jgi:hypothetical protein
VDGEVEGRTACPLESGLMSRNARTFSDSKSLKEGMSPVHLVVSLCLIEVFEGTEIEGREEQPLTILQKMQAAEDMVVRIMCCVELKEFLGEVR